MKEDGTITMIGQGSCMIDLPFAPTSFHSHTVDDPHDPGPMSQIPVKKELVDCFLKVNPSKAGYWQLVFKWDVFGTKVVSWQISA